MDLSDNTIIYRNLSTPGNDLVVLEFFKLDILAAVDSVGIPVIEAVRTSSGLYLCLIEIRSLY